ncbi:MBL fold metallo-hydrolase [Hominifimenecus sp. rT4P-3]|uniref:MBL fold metallo-hydrolase n=1 Tax=Hominifimenecus sp. rT4P-3 TaxID=3242979 RepID=UPI003DA212B9
MGSISRFGNMNPPEEYMARPYLMDREPFPIADHLFFVGNLWCSSHLIDTGDGLILLDTPCACGLPGLIRNIGLLGYQVRDIKYIVVSHAHTDHYGAVAALQHMSGAKTFIGKIDAKDMRHPPEYLIRMGKNFGHYNEFFIPDVELEDGDEISLGDTRIRCVVTPGHTSGVMSHFWKTRAGGKLWNVGIYGGAGFLALSRENLKKNGQPLILREEFIRSIDKVWNEKVDIMLGNHPFHNDVYQKHQRVENGEKDAFIDPEEWHRYLGGLKQEYKDFLELSPEEVAGRFGKSRLLEYYGIP